MKERRAVRFLFGGIFLRIAIMFLGVLVFSSAIVLFFMNSVFQKKTFEETLRSQSYSVLQLQNGLDAYLESIDQLTLGLVYNGSVQSMLQGKIPDPYTMIALLDASARRENLYILLADGYGRVYTFVQRHGSHQIHRAADAHESLCGYAGKLRLAAVGAVPEHPADRSVRLP